MTQIKNSEVQFTYEYGCKILSEILARQIAINQKNNKP